MKHRMKQSEIKAATIRQRRRRLLEKKWLEEHKITSWESLHTELMSGKKRVVDVESKQKEQIPAT